MSEVFDRPLAEVARALRAREVSATELTDEALRRHEAHGEKLHAYKHFDAEGARAAARAADEALTGHADPPPFCGIPVSVKDLYGLAGMPIFAGTAKRLPEAWERDAWLVGRLRELGAVFTGKTHTVELAYGGVGINPHWGTPWNPWDADVHRIPGGSSCGAGVSLWEGSALVALGSDTGGSIRIPASLTGCAGHKSTRGRWPTDGVVPLSPTLDSVGALSRSIADSVYFFGAVDPAHGDPAATFDEVSALASEGFRMAVPRCGVWDACQPDIAAALHAALDELEAAGWVRTGTDGGPIDTASALYVSGRISGSELMSFLPEGLPGWFEVLHATVGGRIADMPAVTSDAYKGAIAERERMAAEAPALFAGADVLALPTQIATPPPVAELESMEAYVKANAATLRPTCPVSMLGLCAVTLPVGLDDAGMPVGLQLVAPAGRDELALAAGLAAERVLGTARDRLGLPPAVGSP